MLFVHACIVGGVVYTGIKTLLKRRPRQKTFWLVTRDSQTPRDPAAATPAGRMIPDETATSRHHTTASVALGLSVSGALFYAPLSLVSVPLVVYDALPILERTWAALLTDGRLNMATVQSVAVIGSLATQRYIMASLITWLHYSLTLVALRVRHFNTLLWRGLEHDPGQFLTYMYGAKPHSVWVQAQGMEIEIPFEKLRIGDMMVVREGNLIPAEGIVVEGTAEVSLLLATGEARLAGKKLGDRVIPSTMVVSGKMCIRVERL